MWIVSQDKEAIFNLDQIINIGIEKTNGQFYIEADGDTVGIYRTEERALQVLEDIHRVYGLSELYKYSTEEEREAIMDGLSQVDQMPFKYIMPLE